MMNAAKIELLRQSISEMAEQKRVTLATLKSWMKEETDRQNGSLEDITIASPLALAIAAFDLGEYERAAEKLGYLKKVL